MKTRIRSFEEYTEKLTMFKSLGKPSEIKEKTDKTVFNVLMSELVEYYNSKI